LNSAAAPQADRAKGRHVPAWALALPVVIVLIAVGAGSAAVWLGRPAQTIWVAPGHARIGGTAPDFTSWDLSGKRVSLSEFGARPVLLTFWATWCTVCRDELPVLQSLQDRYRSDGLLVLALNYRETSTDQMRAYLAGLRVGLQPVVDPDGAIAAAYGVDVGLPVNVMIDRSGTVAQILIGQAQAAVLETAIKQVVARSA
jgi:thiol-disulfide isomerase/thioredoxin